MAGTFTIGALALAAEGANAVGAVRITLLQEVVEIELVRAAGFRAGFVPGSVAESVDMRVPYTAIRGLVRRGRALCLALDPSISAPYTRFTLARFTYDPREALSRAYEARRRAALLVALLPLPLGAALAFAAPETLVSGLVGRAAVCLVVTFVTWIVLREILRFATWGGPSSDRLAEAFELALCQRLGFAPVTTPPFVPPHPTAPKEPLLPPFARAPLLVALIAALAVVGISLFKQYVPPPDPAEIKSPVALLTARITPGAISSMLPPVPEAEAQAAPRLPRCVCARADSPLWSEGLSKLSVYVAARPEDGSNHVVPSAKEGGSPAYAFDLSVVNNTQAPMRDVSVLVTFARRNEKGKRVGATDRGLFWGRPLLPGRAVKWHIEGPGTEMRIDPGITGDLDPSAETASPDAFFELGKARQRVVRIHAAKMLAYQQDPRALSVLDAIGPPSSGEELVLSRIRRASSPVVACGITPVAEALEVCLFNNTVAPRRVAQVATVASDESPARSFPLDVVVPVHDGVKISIPDAARPAPQELAVDLAAETP